MDIKKIEAFSKKGFWVAMALMALFAAILGCLLLLFFFIEYMNPLRGFYGS